MEKIASETEKKSDNNEKKIIVSGHVSGLDQWELTYLVKDNFWTELFPTTASSHFLTNFLPHQDATVIKLLQKGGYQLQGKTVMDELACGGLGLYAATGSIFNPYHSSHVAGGSSVGSAVAVARKIVPMALGHDTGDSVRRPAAYCGVVGFKPSYGLISRFGVIPMASSLDTVGILAEKVSTVKKVFSLLNQPDPNDLLTITTKPQQLRLAPTQSRKIAIIANLETNLSTNLTKLYQDTCQRLEKLGYSLHPIVFPKKIRDHLQITYLILCSTELVSHLNSLQGITYGVNENITITQKRSKYLGKVVKERLLIGAYLLNEPKLLIQAQKMRYLVKQWLEKIFRNYNFLVFPSTNEPAPPAANFTDSFSGLLSDQWSDNLLLLANLVGLPSLSLPMGFVNNLPVSINLNSAYGCDQAVLQLATELENKN